MVKVTQNKTFKTSKMSVEDDYINDLRKGYYNSDVKMPIPVEEAIHHIYSDYALLVEIVNNHPEWNLPEEFQVRASFFSNTSDYIGLARDFLGLTFYNCTSVVDYALITDNFQLLKRVIEFFVSPSEDYPNICYHISLPFADNKKKFHTLWSAFYSIIDLKKVEEKTVSMYAWTKYLFE